MAVAGAGRGDAYERMARRANQVGGTAGQGRGRVAGVSRHRQSGRVGQDVGMVARPVRVPDRYPCRAARRCKLHLSCRSRNYRIVPYARRATRIGDDVTQLTLAEAAKAAGRSKSALLRSIKAGRLSATRDALTGGWVVEASELHRLYTLPREAVTDAPEMIELRARLND